MSCKARTEMEMLGCQHHFKLKVHPIGSSYLGKQPTNEVRLIVGISKKHDIFFANASFVALLLDQTFNWCHLFEDNNP